MQLVKNTLVSRQKKNYQMMFLHKWLGAGRVGCEAEKIDITILLHRVTNGIHNRLIMLSPSSLSFTMSLQSTNEKPQKD